MKILSDEYINDLVAERKIAKGLSLAKLSPKDKPNSTHKASSIDMDGENGNLFRVNIRQSKENVLDFSIILILRDKETNQEFKIARYNGRHASQHTNKLEKAQGEPNYRFGPCFHKHKATQRYQEAGFKIEGYAEETSEYNDLYSALDVFIHDFNIVNGDEQKQPDLFH